jgi:hypothetical protein
LSIEANAKTYGKGMLKVEPGGLRKVLVIKQKDKKINLIYKDIYNFLSNNDKESAMKLATEFINEHLGVSQELANSVHLTLREFHRFRLGKNAQTDHRLAF